MLTFVQSRPLEAPMELTTLEGQAVKYDFFAKEDGNVIGTAQLYIITDDRHPAPVGNVQNVWTDPAYRGRGIARQIMETLHETARRAGCSKLVLTSNPSRAAARDLYTSMGYEQVTDGFQLAL
jgi:ribosomal protein S18 acetylase RimI-like enzyme